MALVAYAQKRLFRRFIGLQVAAAPSACEAFTRSVTFGYVRSERKN
jgi:hypothetical protein